MENSTKRKLDFDDEGTDQSPSKRAKTESCTLRNDNLASSVPILERDGRSITTLCVEYNITGIKPLLDAIVKYCGDNITQVEFTYRHPYDEKRNTTEYNEGLLHFRTFLLGFNARFANLTSLTIAYQQNPEPADIKHWDEIMNNFPMLRSLTIKRCPKFPLENFFRANGQLERLTLANSSEWRIDRDLLEKIDELLPNLNYLDMEFVNAHKPLYKQPFGQTYFKNLQTLKVCSHNKEHSNVLRFLSPAAEKLETFEFLVAGGLDDKALKMLAPYKQLKQLEFRTYVTNKQLPILATQVPQIEMLTMGFKKKEVTGMGIVKLIEKCKQLKKIVIHPGFRVYDKDIEALCNPIRNKLDDEWSIDDDDGSIEITKNDAKPSGDAAASTFKAKI